MYLSGRHELFVLLGTFIGGLILGLVVDFFRILRRNFKGAASFVWLQDVVMWAVMLFVVYATVFITDDGDIRWYQFLGFAAGALIYMLLLSNFVIKISSAVISFFKIIFGWIFVAVAFPFKILGKFVIKPVAGFWGWCSKRMARLFATQKNNFFRFLRIFKKI